jgi:hypothetical protein
MGWGGKRHGAGRKPKPKLPATVLNHPSVPPPSTNYPPPPVEEFDAPDSLTADERKVWLTQAPFAFKAGTLTRASALSFERYCRIVVLEQNEARSSGMGGSNHRGLMKQINAYELQFLLTPSGKAMPALEAPAAEPESKLSKFRR